MPLGFQCRHPGGMAENSPAFQRWDRGPGVPSPEGTAENHKFSRPFGTQPSIRPHPALKRRAIFKSPSGTKNGLYAAPVDQILVALDFQSAGSRISNPPAPGGSDGLPTER